MRRLAQHLHRDGALDDPMAVYDEGGDPGASDPTEKVVVSPTYKHLTIR